MAGYQPRSPDISGQVVTHRLKLSVFEKPKLMISETLTVAALQYSLANFYPHL